MTLEDILWNADREKFGKQSICHLAENSDLLTVNAESVNDMKLGIRNHYAAVLNQAPSDNLVKVSSESSLLTNKYVYSFSIPEICTTLGTSRSNTAPESDGMPTRVLQLC